MDNTVRKIKQQDCTGCKACGMICPVGAIIFERNREGFEYPSINMDKCIQCGKCLTVCSVIKDLDEEKTRIQPRIYAARNRNKSILKSSSSGGIFTAFADDVLVEGGIVYGVCFDEKFSVVYKRGTCSEDIRAMRGSKYVDAYIDMNVLRSFVEDIKSDKRVLFTGTPCQIQGMKKMCKQMGLPTENVIWIDFFVCSGKVSSYLWDKEKQEYMNQGKLEEISFRNKKGGWKNFKMHRTIDGISYDDDFLLHRWSKFLNNFAARRPPCGMCKYGGSSDISLGDMWYSITIPKSWKDNQGISIVRINTPVGAKRLSRIMEQLEMVEIIEPIIKNVKYEIYGTDEENKRRKNFWDVYYNEGWKKLCDMYAKITWKEKLLFGIVRPLLIKTGLLDVIKRKDT